MTAPTYPSQDTPAPSVERPSAEPTPRPWTISPGDRGEIEGGGRTLLGLYDTKPQDAANAALIVRAVNVHEELIAALREFVAAMDLSERDDWRLPSSFFFYADNLARAALAKAGAGQ